MWFVYILLCKDGSFYIGSSNDVEKRFSDHKNGKGGRYTRSHPVVKILHTEKYKTKSEALKRETELKKWPKDKKETLIRSCSQCGICCRLFLINLTEKEWKSGRYKTQLKKSHFDDDFSAVLKYGGNIVSQNKDGSCIYLKNNKCSIHERRPQSCREFFCTSTLKKYKDMIQIIKKRRESSTMCLC
jgi:putative endonuclease